MITRGTKKILWLMAIATIMVFIVLACKKKPTNTGDFFSIEQAPGEIGQIPEPDKKLSIDSTQGLIQFKGLSFKSGVYNRKKSDGSSKLVYYYADVKVDSQFKPYISVVARDFDENIVEDQGKFYSTANETGAIYNLKGDKYDGAITAEFVFVEEGYLKIKFNNYSGEVICSLTERKIDSTQGLIQFEGLSFKSGSYRKNGESIYYYADVKVDSQFKPYISVVKKSSNGNIVKDEGEFYSVANETGTVYNLERVKYNGSSKITGEFVFSQDVFAKGGYLKIKFNNYSDEIICSLIE